MITEELRKLYQSYTGSPAEEITELPSSGSNRRYFRIKGPETLIGVSGTSIEENEAFIYMAKHFRGKGLPVPQVYASSDDHSFYIQEDLGDNSEKMVVLCNDEVEYPWKELLQNAIFL